METKFTKLVNRVQSAQQENNARQRKVFALVEHEALPLSNKRVNFGSVTNENVY